MKSKKYGRSRALQRRYAAAMRTILLVLVLAIATSASADPMLVAQPADFHWKAKDALPPGAFGATLRGDPAKGAYDFVGKFPAQYTVPLHSHTNECVVVMLDGAMTIGRPGEPDVTIAKAGLFVLPAKLAYTAHCDAACSFLVHGDKPFDITYANPKDDPRKSR
jgi:hypothetical protein